MGSLFLRRPTSPQTSILSPTHGPTPTPTPSCPRGSLLPPPSTRPLAREGLSSPQPHLVLVRVPGCLCLRPPSPGGGGQED